MSRTCVVACIGAVLLVLSYARPAHASSNMFEVSGGFAKSTDDAVGTGDKMGGGASFGGAYWRRMTPVIDLGGEISYDNMGSVTYDNTLTANNKFMMHALRVNPAMRLNMGQGQTSKFFFQGGGGLYNVTAKAEDSFFGNLQNTDAKFGINGGVGGSFSINPNTQLVFTALYHNVFMDPEALNYLHFRGGAMFMF